MSYVTTGAVPPTPKRKPPKIFRFTPSSYTVSTPRSKSASKPSKILRIPSHTVPTSTLIPRPKPVPKKILGVTLPSYTIAGAKPVVSTPAPLTAIRNIVSQAANVLKIKPSFTLPTKIDPGYFGAVTPSLPQQSVTQPSPRVGGGGGGGGGGMDEEGEQIDESMDKVAEESISFSRQPDGSTQFEGGKLAGFGGRWMWIMAAAGLTYWFLTKKKRRLH